MRAVACWAVPVLVLGLWCSGGRAEELPYAMFSDPPIDLPEQVETLSPKLLPLWLQALEAPEADLQRQAAEAIAAAHAAGLADLRDASQPLVRLLGRPELHPTVVLAAARALVVLDARQAADVLWRRVGKAEDMELAQVVEPALARWGYRPARAVWLKRLASPHTRRYALLLAIQGLAAAKEHRATAHLRRLVTSREAGPDIRLAAAAALGRIETQGLEELAGRLAADTSPGAIVDRLAAASMLAGHSSQTARELLRQLAVDAEPAVAAVALGRLLELDPAEVIDLFDRIKDSPDANVRLLAARGLGARPAAEQIVRLGPMLDDRHPDVRRFVRKTLEEHAAKPELRPAVIQQASRMLATNSWRGLEQAIILVVNLDYKPAAPRLVELLEFERPEVFIAAAWGLRCLAVPDTLEAIYQKALKETRTALKQSGCSAEVSRQLGHLLEALGRQRYAPSDDLLRLYVPENSPFDAVLRAAAVWALGHLHAGHPDPALVKQLVDRLTDEETAVDPGEATEVRAMSAVSLGRMQAKETLGVLNTYAKVLTTNDPIGYACAWAVEQITGQPIPEPKQLRLYRGGWFLMPLDEVPDYH